MSTAIALLSIALAACVAYLVIRAVGGVYLRYRGTRVIRCPETQQPAGVHLDLKHAAGTALRGATELRLDACSRWPERRKCGQECLSQIEESPEDCLVRVMFVKWYADKDCVCCGKPIGEIHLTDHRPALLNPSGRLVEWQEVAPENLPAVLSSHRPVCWNCLVVQRMIGEHPELVVDRSRRA